MGSSLHVQSLNKLILPCLFSLKSRHLTSHSDGDGHEVGVLAPDLPRPLDDSRGTEAEADLAKEAGVVLERVFRPGHPRQHVAQNPLLTAARQF